MFFLFPFIYYIIPIAIIAIIFINPKTAVQDDIIIKDDNNNKINNINIIILLFLNKAI